MTRTAEIDGIGRRESAGIEDCSLCLRGFPAQQRFSGDYMIATRSVTSFACNARYDCRSLKLIVDGGGGGMAGKTTDDFRASYRSGHSLLQILRICELASRREIQSFEIAKVRNTAFKEISIPLEQVRLANVAIAKRPHQRSGNGALAVCLNG